MMLGLFLFILILCVAAHLYLKRIFARPGKTPVLAEYTGAEVLTEALVAALPTELRTDPRVGCTELESANPTGEDKAAVSSPLMTLPTGRPSQQIAELLAAFGERPMTLREVVNVLRGRAYILLILLLALPFCTPIPLPGLSLPFGVVIALVGFRLALDRPPSLPGKLLDTRLPAGFFKRLLAATQGILWFLEKFLRPRLRHLLDARVFRHGYGVIIAVCGLLLLLPLPIPLSNGLPALTVVLLAGAMLERDGGCMVAGLLSFALTLCFYAALAWGGVEGVSFLKDWLGATADTW